MELKKTVCYEDFGAVGDGVTDDFDAISRAHAYANENGLDVVTDGTKTYYIGDTGIGEKENKPAIKIKTNVDWGTSNFIIDDSSITSSMFSKNANIFCVAREHAGVTYTKENDSPSGIIAKINADGGIKRDAKKLDLGIGYEAMLLVINENKKVYVRIGANKDNGSAQSEVICVDKDGNIDPATPFLLDYDEVTKIVVYRIDDKPITLKGGIFTTIANQAKEDYRYYYRNIILARSNVTVTDFTYKIKGEGEHGDPYAAFLNVYHCANVLIKDSTFQSHKYYWCVGAGGGSPVGMGTYAINASTGNNIVWRNCTQSNFYNEDGVTVNEECWGIMGSSYCKNLAYENCFLNRFDAHAGVYNARIVNSHVECFRIIGGGDILVENTHLYNNLLIGMREDYGSTWNGKIILKNVTMHNTDEPYLLYGLWYNHDFGYPTYVPEEVIIDGLKLTKKADINIFTKKFVTQSANAVLDEIDGKPNLNKMTPPKRIIIRNNKDGYNFIKPDSVFFKDTEYIVED